MKLKIKNISNTITKKDDRYTVKDNSYLNNLVVSSTNLHPGKNTSGHFHSGQEEVYFFISGSGSMELNDKTFLVEANTVILIPDGAFHKVYNTGNEDLYFVCVFDGKRNDV